MTSISVQGSAVAIIAYRGDAKGLLTFDTISEAVRADLAGFPVQVTPPGVEPFYIQNNLLKLVVCRPLNAVPKYPDPLARPT